jgi:hypothetical protein
MQVRAQSLSTILVPRGQSRAYLGEVDVLINGKPLNKALEARG